VNLRRRACRAFDRLFPLALVVVLLALVPIAQASPPDPLWIPGIYDAADSDDAILAAASLESRVEAEHRVLSPVRFVADVTPAAAPIARSTTLGRPQPRAPPSV
jgi:hypothetical protein